VLDLCRSLVKGLTRAANGRFVFIPPETNVDVYIGEQLEKALKSSITNNDKMVLREVPMQISTDDQHLQSSHGHNHRASINVGKISLHDRSNQRSNILSYTSFSIVQKGRKRLFDLLENDNNKLNKLLEDIRGQF
jgi:hypothetical protein